MRLARTGTLTGYFGLLVLWLVWSVWPAEGKHPPSALILMVSTLPLLLALRGLLYDRRPAHLGLGLLSLAYFIHGVGALTVRAERWPAFLEILFSLFLFAGTVARLRRIPDP